MKRKIIKAFEVNTKTKTMSDKKKIKDTKLGSCLSEKAPNILGVVGDLLPDRRKVS